MRLTVLRATTVALILAGAVAAPATPALAAAGPHLSVTPPAVVGAGLNPASLPVQVDNTGGTYRSDVRLRFTVTPVAGSPIRPLDPTLRLTYQFGSQWRALSYETRGDTLIATTPGLSSVDADAVTTFQLQISGETSLYAAHVDKVTVDVTTEALDSSGTVFATDGAPDRIALVEPKVTVTGMPAHLAIGTPAVLTLSITNTTTLDYLFVDPALTTFGIGNGYIQLERLDGSVWTPVTRQSSYYFFYANTYAHLHPGDSVTTKLRITFTSGATPGQSGNLYHIGYGSTGRGFGVASQQFTIDAAA